ncbi:hypothetical protein GOB57_24785 [Sinorhizobium meliloti]|nr:hypothetical protein [Sinorhizobium meliloti]
MAIRYVDSFFVDSVKAMIAPSTGVLSGIFEAEFFGKCHIRKTVVGNVEQDLKVMATLATEVFERKITESGSDGVFSEVDRPIEIPEGFTLEFFPPDD